MTLDKETVLEKTKGLFQGDKVIWVVVAILTFISLLAVYSASESVAYPNSAEFLYDLLTKSGLHFNEAYYRYYQKPFDQKHLYPQNLYNTQSYNSLLFKLFNSSGMEVDAEGAETEWAYVGSYEDIEPGDLLFFADTTGKGLTR